MSPPCSPVDPDRDDHRDDLWADDDDFDAESAALRDWLPDDEPWPEPGDFCLEPDDEFD